ncbi:uncharacterized protein LOC125234112 [Leguminivora glycinivorella]|uniref:uncharacterized protein LOC125234112 n=1 Tax=Leguminivora glycinivorella TaxID=1035111 RepID=UPI00200D6CB7|nr:uncharacterized protein LOC125234112 [Leguminivora glycinivorella]
MSLRTKFLLKDCCRFVYYAGCGNYWYEDINHETIPFKLYRFISFSIYTVMIFLENVAAAFGSFPSVEKNSAVMFAAIHNIVLTKMYLFLYHKVSIRKLNFEMGALGENLEEDDVMKKQYWKVKYGILFYVVTVYLSLGAYGVESTRKSIVEGAPFYTVVTYWPAYEDLTTIAAIARIFFYITWLYMMLPMMSADCAPIAHLICIAYKFQTLRRHFEKIREEFDGDLVMGREGAEERLWSGCLEGIKIHQKLMYLADEINRIFGIIMSLQVCESSAVAVLLLLRLALSPDMDLTNAFMTYTFVGSLFFLLALNLWNAGEITYQASLLSPAVFYCGWHMCATGRPRRDIERLVLIACAQAQKPLVLKAFGIQDLSYSTFVSVARMTYSVFAVFYQRGG